MIALSLFQVMVDLVDFQWENPSFFGNLKVMFGTRGCISGNWFNKPSAIHVTSDMILHIYIYIYIQLYIYIYIYIFIA